jgi:hypothetical protein
MHDAPQIVQIPSKAIHAVHDDTVAVPDKLHHRIELFAFNILAGFLVEESSINEDTLKLTLSVLIQGAYSDIADSLSGLLCHRVFWKMCQVRV